MCCRFNIDGNFLGVGLSNGVIKVESGIFLSAGVKTFSHLHCPSKFLWLMMQIRYNVQKTCRLTKVAVDVFSSLNCSNSCTNSSYQRGNLLLVALHTRETKSLDRLLFIYSFFLIGLFHGFWPLFVQLIWSGNISKSSSCYLPSLETCHGRGKFLQYIAGHM